MKDSDQAIDKVLAGLRDAEAPTGMERRILDAARGHASARSRWSWRMMPGWLAAFPSRPAVKPIAYVAALAGVIVLVLAVPAIHRQQQVLTQSAKAIPSALLPPAPPATLAESAEPQRLAMITRSPRRTRPRKLELIDTQESLAVREMNAPSRPARPLPLTAQEKLLVHFVRTSTPEQLAAVDPAKLAADDEQEKAEFDKFFRRLTKQQADKKKSVQEAMNKS